MKNVAEVSVDELPRVGRCPYCGFTYLLPFKVTYYRDWSVALCKTCSLAISRHIRWQGEAHTRYRQRRSLLAEERHLAPS